ncbi:MAG: TonB-dependent receptor [Deltaproteobacteria bacterium]|nr:TonB-dependent receptor [Deltaproteobacteria bacterium]
MTDGWRELFVPLLDPGQRTYLPALLASVPVAFLLMLVVLKDVRAAATAVSRGLLSPSLWRHRSTVLDLQLALAKGLLRGMGLLPSALGAASVAIAVIHGLRSWTDPGLHAAPWLVTALYSVVLFVAWDASRYALHRLMHAVPALWELHQVHHSAEVLTPLTYHRTHPLESALYQLRGALVTGGVAGVFVWLFGTSAAPAQLVGVSAAGFLLNLLGGNLRHSHVWISYGPLENWLISPAQHQIHHAVGRDESNYGVWLALWDRLGGSLELAGPSQTLEMGLADANHSPDDLLGALVGPLRGAALRAFPRPVWLLAVGLLLPVVAFAQGTAPGDTEPEETETEDEDETEESGEDEDEEGPDESITIVDRRGRTPRVAGSAHVVDAEELERFEHNDIHRVLAPVPGVYVRDEDGWGLRPNIGLRGANSDRSAKVALEEDGVLLGPAPYSAPAAYYFPITTRMVGVEVFKGPAATAHGPHTVGGAINLRTRSVPQGRFSGGLDVAYGSFNSLKLHGHVGGGSRTAGAMLEGVLLRTDGFKELDGGGDTGFLKGELMFKGRLATDPSRPAQSVWELKLGYAGEQSRETYLGLSDADFAETPYRRYAASREGLMRWKRAQAELAWSLRAGKNVDVRVVGYYHFVDRSWTKLNALSGGPDLHGLLLGGESGQGAVYMGILRGEQDSEGADQNLLIGTNLRRFHAGGVQARARWRAQIGPVRNELEVGVRVHRDQIARTHDEAAYGMRDAEPVALEEPVVITENRHTATALAAHVTDELAIGPLRVLPGVRLEVIGTRAVDELVGEDLAKTQVVALPGVGVHLQAAPSLSVLAGIHRGFSPSAPSAPAETKPETSANVEAGARFDYRGVYAEAIGFYNGYENLTGQCTFSGGCRDDQLGDQFNAGRVHVFGLEALLGGEIDLPQGFGLYGRVTYTLTGSRFASTFVSGFPQFGLVEAGDELPYVPVHQGSANVGFRFPIGTIELGAKAQSAMRDVAGQGTIAPTELIPAYVVLDLAANVQISEYVVVYATVNNLTNRKYMVSRRPFGARPGMPLQAMVGAKLRF